MDIKSHLSKPYFYTELLRQLFINSALASKLLPSAFLTHATSLKYSSSVLFIYSLRSFSSPYLRMRIKYQSCTIRTNFYGNKNLQLSDVSFHLSSLTP